MTLSVRKPLVIAVLLLVSASAEAGQITASRTSHDAVTACAAAEDDAAAEADYACKAKDPSSYLSSIEFTARRKKSDPAGTVTCTVTGTYTCY